jgi:hypothetical protein
VGAGFILTLILFVFLFLHRNYIEKTLKEGKEWMAPPTPCLAIRSVLHVGLSYIEKVR